MQRRSAFTIGTGEGQATPPSRTGLAICTVQILGLVRHPGLSPITFQHKD